MLKLLAPLLLAFSFTAVAGDLMSPVTPQETAQDFTLYSPEGETVSLSQFSGKHVLVNFWAHWCSPCIKEFPDMQKLYSQASNNDFEIIAIHAGPYNDEAAQFVKHFNITFPVVSDPDTSLKGWDIPALPMSYLISPDGQIIYKAMGPRTWDYEQMLALINKQP